MKVKAIHHYEYGLAEEVAQIAEYELPELDKGQILIDTKYAPINPADINMAEGMYYTQPKLPSVLGNECVGVVEKKAKDVINCQVGDHVIMPFKSKDNWVGGWAEKCIAYENQIFVIPKSIPLEQASMLTVNPPTAYQLLTLFVDLEPGDYVIQNAANSGVGRWVIYLANKLGFKTINLIRDPSYINELSQLGADHIYIDKQDVHKDIRKIAKAKLALNAVGGQSSLELSKCLEDEGTLVTYGAMSKQPVLVGNGAYIYKNIWTTGFNRTKWIEETSPDVVRECYNTILEYYGKDGFTIPIHETFDFKSINEAMLSHLDKRKGKVLLRF